MHILRFLALAFLLIFTSRQTAFGSPTVGSDINPGVIKTMVMNVDFGPPDRTEVGIGETMSAWIEGAEDYDDVGLGSGTFSQLDTIGNISWTVTGNGTATVYPIVAPSISIYFEPCNSDRVVVINADVDDLFALANDAQKAAPPKNINERVPTAVKVVDHKDYDATMMTEQNPAGRSVYAGSLFLLVVEPQNLPMVGAGFREKFPQQTFDELPDDGPPIVIAAKEKALTLVSGTFAFPPNSGFFTTRKNAFGDDVSGPELDKDRLRLAASCAVCHSPPMNAGDPLDYSFSVSVQYQYKSGPGANDWTTVVTSQHKRDYNATTLKAKVTLQATTSGASAWLGPWRPRTP